MQRRHGNSHIWRSLIYFLPPHGPSDIFLLVGDFLMRKLVRGLLGWVAA